MLPKHLPVLPTARKLARICERGRVISHTEASLLLSVLKNSDLVMLLGPNAELVGQVLDTWYPLAHSRAVKRWRVNGARRGLTHR